MGQAKGGRVGAIVSLPVLVGHSELHGNHQPIEFRDSRRRRIGKKQEKPEN